MLWLRLICPFVIELSNFKLQWYLTMGLAIPIVGECRTISPLSHKPQSWRIYASTPRPVSDGSVATVMSSVYAARKPREPR